jgi:Mg-chelatase subunit ChlI
MVDVSAARRRSAADPPFPFAGVVSQNAVKRVLLLSVVNPRITSVLLSGERDTGKRTAVRGLAELLPNIDAAEGCPAHCILTARERCPACKTSGNPHARARVRMPFVEVPISATEEKLLGKAGANPKPGLLARGNRGFVLMERANLFPEKLFATVMEALESRKANGWPTAFTLVATMNDDEGELADEFVERFALAAAARSLVDIEERLEIIRRVEAYRAEPAEFIGQHERESAVLREKLAAGRRLIARADAPAKVAQAVAGIARKSGAGEKGAECLRDAAIANAVYDGRSWANLDDVGEVVDFALRHRRRGK